MYLYIREGCFNCKQKIFSERLRHGFPCELDISEEAFDSNKSKFLTRKDLLDFIFSELKRNHRLFRFKELYDLEKETETFVKFFKNAVGSEPWTIQVTWFKRLAKNNSFSMIAPTGTGKTTFICLSSIYFAKKGKRIYIILPTSVLVEQVYEKILKFLEKLGLDLKVVAYLRKNKKTAKEEIASGDFNILITSNQFLSKNFELLSDKKFDIIFADDVDALFRGSKNIERVLMLLGFAEEDFTLAYESIKAKRQGDLELINNIKRDLEKVKKKRHGVLVLSSATGRVRGLRTMLYKELLDFSAGSATTKIRNVIDIAFYPKEDMKTEIYKLVKELEDGIVIFVPRDLGSEFAKELEKFLSDKGISCGVVLSEVRNSVENIKKFSNKELNVLIGVAHFYGLLVRGLDLPTRVKYIIFAGIPKMRINLTKREKNIGSILTLAEILSDILPEDKRSKILPLLRRLQRSLRRISGDALRMLSESFEAGKPIEGWLETLRETLEKLYVEISALLDDESILERIKNHPDVSVSIENGDIIMNIPDVKTYIQASGRCSRLYAGGITKGLSIIIVDDEKLLKSLERKLRLLFT